MLAPTSAAPIAPKIKFEAIPKTIADTAIKPIDNIQHRLRPRTLTNLPQTEAAKIAVMNTTAKISDVLCALATIVYLIQNGVANVSTAVI